MKKEDIKNFSLFFALVISLLSGMFKFNIAFWAIGILLIAFIHFGLYVIYHFLRKGVLFLYENYLESWWKAIKNGTQGNRKQKNKQEEK